MNIGLFNENFPPIYDGVSLTVKNYAYWLNKLGHSASVITPNAPGKNDSEFSFPVHRYFSVPLIGRKPYRWGLPLFDQRFTRRLSNTDFDIIHAHTPFSSGKMALKLAKEKNIPIVATFHSKYRNDIQRQAPVKLIVDFMVNNIVSFYNRVDEVWIPQASVEETLREYGYTGNVRVMPNGSDFTIANPSPLRHTGRNELGLRNEEIVLLYVGQHIWEKNIAFIIQALAKIKDLPFRFVTVGKGYAFNGIRKMAEDAGIGHKLLMLGQISDRESLQRVYAASDLFLFPSLYDTFGLVVREAAAMNVPSVLLKNTDAACSITDGYNGFLSEDNVEEYAKLISHLIENPHIVKDAGLNASSSLVHSWENIMNSVVDRYNFLIQSKK